MNKVIIGAKVESKIESKPTGGLLKKASNGTAFAKIGIMGFAGSGKTFTASDIAAGLANLEKDPARKLVAFFDTEKGSDFVQKKMSAAGIELLVHKGRAFTDLISIIKECENNNVSVLIIDSISHVWRDLCDSYLKKTQKKMLTMLDWGILKSQWAEFTNAYINSKLHILMLGRAGHEYAAQENDETGKTEFIKSGTKMKVEGETGFEPDLLLEMERISTNDGIINRCWVIKDRSDTMNGAMIDRPSFESYKSFFNFINIGGVHSGVDVTRNSTAAFQDPDWSVLERNRRRDIALEELNALLVKLEMSGTSGAAQKSRVLELEEAFGTSSKTALENTRPDDLLAGIEKIKIKFADKLGYVIEPKEPAETDVPY